MSINRTFSVWRSGYERRSLEEAQGALTKARAIEHGRRALESIGVRLSPHDDVDRAMKRCMATLPELSAGEAREVRAALLAYWLEQTHGRHWRGADDRRRGAC